MDEKGVNRLILIAAVAIVALVSALAVGFAVIPENPNGGETLLDLPNIADVVSSPFLSHSSHNNQTSNHNATTKDTSKVKNITYDNKDVKKSDKSTNLNKKSDQNSHKSKVKPTDKDKKKDKSKDKDKDKDKDKNSSDKEKSWKHIGTYSNTEPSFSLKDDGDKYKITIIAQSVENENGILNIQLLNGKTTVQNSILSVSDNETNETVISGKGSGDYSFVLDQENIQNYTISIDAYS